MRKLTVKNFSVIEDAELEFGKITVLIGPQASGKSLLCKLAYFLGREVPEIAIDATTNQLPFDKFDKAIHKEFEIRFPRGGWGSKKWSISFCEEKYSVTVTPSIETADIQGLVFTWSKEFSDAYLQCLQETHQFKEAAGFLIPPVLKSRSKTLLYTILGQSVYDFCTYIPTQRPYFVEIKKGFRSLSSNPDLFTTGFANQYADALKPSHETSRISHFLDGKVVFSQNDWMFQFKDGRFLPLQDLSSGSKELLPILTVLDWYQEGRNQSNSLLLEGLYGNNHEGYDDFTIEEPESSIFPKTQYELIKEFVSLDKGSNFCTHFTITTHSPYVLSSFNNLIEAGQAARNHPELKKEIAKIIPEQYWIADGSFKAYAVENGKLTSILNESGFVESNYLDQVSETIGDEFDKLLKLEYDNAKAS